MTKKERTGELTRLMEMTPPTWLTKEKYQTFLDERDTLESQFVMGDALSTMFTSEELNGLTLDDGWKSADGSLSPKFLYDKYLKGEIISDPTTGQDPKMASTDNIRTASKHAGNQWGYKNIVGDFGINTPSAWINFGTFNLIKIDGKLCITPINVEHRLWGLIGFVLGIVNLQSKHPLWFYHHDLPEVYDDVLQKMVRGIKVNDMVIH
jgi:hypothetical protein